MSARLRVSAVLAAASLALFGFTAAAHAEGEVLPVTVRDFQPDGILFEGGMGSARGLAASDLGEDGKPVFSLDAWQALYGEGVTTERLSALFNDVDGVNLSTTELLAMRPAEDGSWELDSSTADDGSPRDGFFPIDGELFGNTEGQAHNYHFSAEIHSAFTYQEGATFYFEGDDDLWVFFNGRLVIDLGGVHSRSNAEVRVDDIALLLGIEPGDLVSFDMFYMERHTTESNLYIRTNFDFLAIPELVEMGLLDESVLIDEGSDELAWPDRRDLTGLWQGYYIGNNAGTALLRNVTFEVMDFSPEDFVANFVFETPASPDSGGEYRVRGHVDEDGTVWFQGYEWVTYLDNFDFIPFEGQLCACGEDIAGYVDGDDMRPFFLRRVPASVSRPAVGLFDIGADDGSAPVADGSSEEATAEQVEASPGPAGEPAQVDAAPDPQPAPEVQPAPDSQPTYDTNESPSLSDVLWITEDMLYGVAPSDIDRIYDLGQVTGGWKGYIISDPFLQFDSMTEHFLNVRIEAGQDAVQAIFDWNYVFIGSIGEGYDDTGTPDSTFSGRWENGSLVEAYGAGRIDITDFWYADGYQYAIGQMTWPDGIPAIIALVRP